MGKGGYTGGTEGTPPGGRWDIVLCDYHVPAFRDFQALWIVRADGSDLPLIIVSGAIGEERAVEARKAGANDYVMKENLTRLIPVVDRELAEAEVQRRHRETQDAAATIEDHLDALMNITDDGVWSVDARDFCLLFFNKAFAGHFSSLGVETRRDKVQEEILPGETVVEEGKELYRRAV